MSLAAGGSGAARAAVAGSQGWPLARVAAGAAAAAALLALALAGGARGAGPAPKSGPAPVDLPRGSSPAAAAPARAAGCLIEPDRWADVGSPVIGVVDGLQFDRGDRVRRGQPLVQLRAAVEQAARSAADTRAGADAELRAAQAAAELAEQNYVRTRSLESARFVSPMALDQTVGELKLARERVAQARVQQRIWADESRLAAAQLNQRTVRAPFDGVVVERFVNLGERVEDRPLLRLAVVDPLRVELMVAVTHWGRLHPGDMLQVQPELPGAGPVAATVDKVDGVIDAASNSFRVRLKLPNPGRKLPAGMRCKVDLDSVQAGRRLRDADLEPGTRNASAARGDAASERAAAAQPARAGKPRASVAGKAQVLAGRASPDAARRTARAKAGSTPAAQAAGLPASRKIAAAPLPPLPPYPTLRMAPMLPQPR